MNEKQESVQATLQSIRELMNSSKNKANSDVFELTEDDLFDEQDEDAYYECRIPKKEEKLRDINEILTQISHSINKRESNTESLKDSSVSAENAAKSIEAIKNLIKKAEQTEVKASKPNKHVTLEEMTMEILKPLLRNWMDIHLPSMVQQVIEKEVKRLISEKDKNR